MSIPASNGLFISSITGATSFKRFDANNDGEISAKEMAQSYLNLRNSSNSTDIMIAQVFGTMLQGGTDSKGLDPDGIVTGSSKNNTISAAELNKLAAAAGDSGKLEIADFQAVFGNRVGSGNPIDLTKMQAIAAGTQTHTYVGVPTTTTPPTPPTTDPALTDIKNTLGQVMSTLMKVLYLNMYLVQQHQQPSYGGGYGGGYGYPMNGYGGGFGGSYGYPMNNYSSGYPQQSYGSYGYDYPTTSNYSYPSSGYTPQIMPYYFGQNNNINNNVNNNVNNNSNSNINNNMLMNWLLQYSQGM